MQKHLNAFSLDPDVVAELKGEVEILAEAYDRCEREADGAVAATADRDDLLAELRGRVRHFTIVLGHAEAELEADGNA